MTVRVEADGPVTTVTLDRADTLNAVTGRLVADLRDALAAIGDDAECRAVVLTGAGRGFCSGMDLTLGLGTDRSEATAMMRTAVAAILLMRGIPQPVVAAVNGPAVGAGFALASASDLRIAGPDAVFSAPFLRLGMSAGDLSLSWFLPRQIGAARASQLFLTAGSLDAAEALALGYVSEVVADPVARARQLAARIAEHPATGVRETKRLLDHSIAGEGFAEHLERELQTQVDLAFAGDLDRARDHFIRQHHATTPT
ncbi:enoyl-CoA hydratase/isomerase family protein [Aeromicrobium sp. Leaf350]|uniref:enoyl-CoA hydratase/isomerase family protein n=1 Tax=Aeromicrobium sp. Leaf350 TaxID=2876565 RepID=UPI001E5F44DE|nr:enoyl-CoA hydratase/isomerase family protein [Aeromicrobium sp. Leaf350]